MLSAITASILLAAPVTQAEAATLGRDIEASLVRGVDAIGPRFDSKTFVDRTLAGLSLPADFTRGFREGIEKQAGQTLSGGLVTAVKEGGSVRFKKVVTLDGAPALQFRMLGADGAFEVFELRLGRGGDGAVRINDLFELSAGELRSQAARRMAITAASAADPGLVDRLLGKNKATLAGLKDVGAMGEAFNAGRVADVVSLYGRLPKALQQERHIQRMRVLASAGIGDDAAYEAAMAEYLALFPKDASSHVIGLDYFFMRKRWADFDRSIAIVEKRVGKDEAWIEMLRAIAATGRGDAAGAHKHYEEAIAREDSMVLPYANLADLDHAAKDWAGVAKWLGAMEAKTDGNVDAVLALPDYADFVASKEGKAFTKKRAAARAKAPK